MARRDLRRWRISWAIQIRDSETNKWFGNIRDITTAGMGMVSKYPLKPTTIHSLTLDLSDEDVPFDEIIVEAKIVWCKQKSKDLFIAGMEFKGTTPDMEKRVQAIIDQFGFPA